MSVDKYGGATVVARIATHVCPYCNLHYGSLAGLGQHLLRKHEGERIPSPSSYELTEAAS